MTIRLATEDVTRLKGILHRPERRYLADYRTGKGDFADYYLGRTNESGGAEITLTFDGALKGNPRFRVLPA